MRQLPNVLKFLFQKFVMLARCLTVITLALRMRDVCKGLRSLRGKHHKSYLKSSRLIWSRWSQPSLYAAASQNK